MLKLLSVMTGDRRYEAVLQNPKGGVANMCDVAERLENKGRKEGIAEVKAILADNTPS